MQFWNSLKRVTYRAGMSFLKFLWRAAGGRHLKVFGHKYRLSPDTIFPHYRKFRLPKGGPLSEIVRYADYVQFHAAVMYVSELGDRSVIVDIGAHHGAYAVVLGRIVQERRGKVIAIEPNPESFAILKENVRLNKLEDTVICERFAVGDTERSMPLEMMGSQSHITKDNASPHTVEVITLEALLAKYSIAHLDLLIIDVEGAELSVLRGFPWGTVGVGRIFCELHPYAWEYYGYTRPDFLTFLSDCNYRCFDMYMKEYGEIESERYIGPAILLPSRKERN